jgi:hypothetical protein
MWWACYRDVATDEVREASQSRAFDSPCRARAGDRTGRLSENIPEGRKAEDGVIGEKYPLVVLKGAGYLERTRKNVEDSDGTLILFTGVLSGGGRN